MTTDSELKPCPFCGGEAEIVELLASPYEMLWGGDCKHCHPDDAARFDFIDQSKMMTSTLAVPGKPYAIDINYMRNLLMPDSELLVFPERNQHE